MSLLKNSIVLLGLLASLASVAPANPYTFAVISDPLVPGVSFFAGFDDAGEAVGNPQSIAGTDAFGIDKAGHLLGLLENSRANSGFVYSGFAFEPFGSAPGESTFGYRIADAAEIVGNYFDQLVNGDPLDSEGNSSESGDDDQ